MASNTNNRAPALDFTKGALVLIMVLYHWLNYFYSVHGYFYRYLRFLPPSFIFITGFLISHIYFSKYSIADPNLRKRLIRRGLKLLAIFILLNLAISSVISESYDGRILFAYSSLKTIVSVYVVGNTFVAGGKLAAFYVLVPISYLLILSAGLLPICKLYKYVYHITCILSLVCVIALNIWGLESSNLELITIGLLGLICGYIPIERVNMIIKRPYVLGAGYVCYLTAITIWDATYPLEIIGVCLTLIVIYSCGTWGRDSGKVWQNIILLGRYSLFGYITQVAVLQLLHRSLRHNEGAGTLCISFFVALFFTIMIVVAVDWARTKAGSVNRLYVAVFS